MSASPASYSRTDATPQSVQKLLDENAQLIRVLVENMNVKGKSTECIQYQQTLHRNLIYLASLADPSLNLQSVLPPPGSSSMIQQRTSNSPQQQSTPGHSSPSVPYSTSTGPPSTTSMSSQLQQHHRQPQATVHMSSPQSTASSEVHWTSSSQPMRLPPNSAMDATGAQYGVSKGYPQGGTMGWGPQGQPGPYGMQRGGSSIAGTGGGYPMGMSMEDRRRQQQQMLRMHQEQLIQAQQARRMQQQGGGMFPPPPHAPPTGMMPPPPPQHQGVMPPSYPQTSTMTPPTMPPGPPMPMH